MFKTHTVEIEWAGRPLKLEPGRIARQSDGAVLATYAEPSVPATVVAATWIACCMSAFSGASRGSVTVDV